MTDAELAIFEAALRELAGPRVRTGVARVADGDPDALAPVEWALVERAHERRRRELAAGRQLLRRLMGLDVVIPRAPSGAAVVPAPFVVALAHDVELVVGVVGERPEVAAVGIDVEPCAELDAETAAVVLRADEAGVDAGLAFVLKEAAYKAWSGLGGRFLEHHDVRVEVGEGEFTATVHPDGVTIPGRWTTVAGRWLALSSVP